MIKHVSLILLWVSIIGCINKKEVDLIIQNAHIFPITEKEKEYESMAIHKGVIIDIGKENQILNKYSSNNKIDVKSAFVYPGFIDAHCHFLNYGITSNQLNLKAASSFDEVIKRCKIYYKQYNPSWLIGRGWDQNIWHKKSFPNKEKLDLAFPNIPVVLTRIDGHAILVNQKALDLSKINETTKVKGGHIEIINGKLTGILIDNAIDIVNNIIPRPDKETKKRALLTAQKKCFEFGLTTIDEAGLNKSDIILINNLHKSGELKMKIYAMLSDNKINFDYFIDSLAKPIKTDRLNVRSFKFYSDGALGSRGACLLRPYSDIKDSMYYGMLLSNADHFKECAKKLYKNEFQMCTHCIGDSSARLILNIYSEILKGVNDKRWRIEHAQVISSSDFQLFKDYTIIPSVQPTHATSDMLWAVLRLGKNRIINSYAYKKLLNQNGMIALGTDFPIEDINPLLTFYAAVARKNINGEPKNGFQIENALSRWEAIQGMTIWAAVSNFEETEKGTLEKGKMADFIVLDQNLFTINDQEILNTKVIATYINGELVYHK